MLAADLHLGVYFSATEIAHLQWSLSWVLHPEASLQMLHVLSHQLQTVVTWLKPSVCVQLTSVAEHHLLPA